MKAVVGLTLALGAIVVAGAGLTACRARPRIDGARRREGVVTGAASGIGRALLHELEPFAVCGVAVDRDEARARAGD